MTVATSTYASSFTDLPGYTSDTGVAADHERQMVGSVTTVVPGDAQASIRVAWGIIIGSLVLLWILGYAFK